MRTLRYTGAWQRGRQAQPGAAVHQALARPGPRLVGAASGCARTRSNVVVTAALGTAAGHGCADAQARQHGSNGVALLKHPPA